MGLLSWLGLKKRKPAHALPAPRRLSAAPRAKAKPKVRAKPKAPARKLPRWVVYDSDYIGKDWHRGAFLGVSDAATSGAAVRAIAADVDGARAMSARKWLAEGGSISSKPIANRYSAQDERLAKWLKDAK